MYSNTEACIIQIKVSVLGAQSWQQARHYEEGSKKRERESGLGGGCYKEMQENDSGRVW